MIVNGNWCFGVQWFIDNLLFEGKVGVVLGVRRQRIDTQLKMVVELIAVAPVEYVCLLYHTVDVVLDVADQGDFMNVELFEKIYKLFLGLHL